MKPLIWLWIAAVIVMGMIVGAALMGWLIILGVVALLYEPLWAHFDKGGTRKGYIARRSIAAALTAFIGLGTLYGAQTQNTITDAQRISAESDKLIADLDIEYLADKPNQKWVYETKVDPVTDKVVRTACIASKNVVQLSSPYDPTRARLCLRDSPQHGKDAFIKLERSGQILCEYSGCRVGVRFDKKAQRQMRAGGADDHSSEIIFIADRKAVEDGIKGATTMIVRLKFYQAGDQDLTFDVQGFEWPSG